MPKYPRNIFNLCFKLFWWIETFLIAFETKKQNVQYLHIYDRSVEEPFKKSIDFLDILGFGPLGVKRKKRRLTPNTVDGGSASHPTRNLLPTQVNYN